MKILHTSDWHLGKVIHEHSLLEDQEHALQQIINIQNDDPHDVIVVAGDIYDRSLPPADAVGLLSRFLTNIRSVSDAPVVIIPGNHDSSVRLAYCAQILTVSGIYIQTDPRKVDEPVVLEANGEVAHIYAVPYLDPWVYNIHADDEEPVKPTHESAVAEAMERISKARDSAVCNILVAHLFASGGAVSESERKFIGTSGEVSAELLNGFDYVALGHLHKPQPVNRHVHYSGSLLKYSFSEHNHVKQVLSVVVSENETSITSLPLVPLRDMVRLKGSCNELLTGQEYEKFCDYYIEAELTDDLLVVNPLNQLKKRFPNILSVRQSPKDIEVNENTNQDERIFEGSTVIDDFMNFYSYIYNGQPDDHLVKLFSSLQEREEQE